MTMKQQKRQFLLFFRQKQNQAFLAKQLIHKNLNQLLWMLNLDFFPCRIILISCECLAILIFVDNKFYEDIFLLLWCIVLNSTNTFTFIHTLTMLSLNNFIPFLYFLHFYLFLIAQVLFIHCFEWWKKNQRKIDTHIHVWLKFRIINMINYYDPISESYSTNERKKRDTR